MRLIDIADLEKFIQENVCAIGDDHLLLVAGDDGRWHEALPLVKTAYSVDKVVEELEIRVNEANNNCLCEMHENGHTLDFENENGRIKGLKDAIEIVKQGGVFNDVCEWKYNNSEYYWESSCDHLHIFMSDGPKENEYEFCPYCGKKIKVVE